MCKYIYGQKMCLSLHKILLKRNNMYVWILGTFYSTDGKKGGNLCVSTLLDYMVIIR